jgi:hypothetical protein
MLAYPCWCAPQSCRRSLEPKRQSIPRDVHGCPSNSESLLSGLPTDTPKKQVILKIQSMIRHIIDNNPISDSLQTNKALFLPFQAIFSCFYCQGLATKQNFTLFPYPTQHGMVVVGWNYGTYGTHGTYGYGTMGLWDDFVGDYGTVPCTLHPAPCTLHPTHHAPRTTHHALRPWRKKKGGRPVSASFSLRFFACVYFSAASSLFSEFWPVSS